MCEDVKSSIVWMLGCETSKVIFFRIRSTTCTLGFLLVLSVCLRSLVWQNVAWYLIVVGTVGFSSKTRNLAVSNICPVVNNRIRSAPVEALFFEKIGKMNTSTYSRPHLRICGRVRIISKLHYMPVFHVSNVNFLGQPMLTAAFAKIP